MLDKIDFSAMTEDEIEDICVRELKYRYINKCFTESQTSGVVTHEKHGVSAGTYLSFFVDYLYVLV